MSLFLLLAFTNTSQARVVAPWVDEHPDVFNDPNFSVSIAPNNDPNCSSISVATNDNTFHDSMDVSLPQGKHTDVSNLNDCLSL